MRQTPFVKDCAFFYNNLIMDQRNHLGISKKTKYADLLLFLTGLPAVTSTFYQIKFWVKFILYLMAKYTTFKLAMTTGFLFVTTSYCIAFSTNLTLVWNGNILVKFSFHSLVNYITFKFTVTAVGMLWLWNWMDKKSCHFQFECSIFYQ